MNTHIKIDVSQQSLELFEAGKLRFSCLVSTAKNGVGQHDGSLQTPLGRHRIHEKIGEGMPIHTVFKARVPTGEIYTSELALLYPERNDWILTRILWLDGMEEGFNQGGDVDSQNRKIYIHGAPESRPMGQPLSHGCITLHNDAMLTLFDLVSVGDTVEIIKCKI